MKKMLLTMFAAVALFGGIAVAETNAACAYPAYLNSRGQCVQAQQNIYTYQYQAQPYYYQSNQQQALIAQIAQLEALLQQLRDLQNQAYVTYNPYTPYNSGNNGSSRVDVTTESATDIDDDRARLRGEVDFNNEDEAVVYFEWGESRSRLDERTIPIVLDEDDDDEDFYQTITRLDDDTTYYFRAVAEDERGNRDYGSIEDFRTDDRRGGSSRDDDEPEVETGDADDVDEDSAELNGDVDMNDFNNGLLFFVYGEDEDQVDDIARDYDEYRDIDEDGDDLQKVLVDNDVDGRATAYADIYGLDDDTDIFFALCVEFEDDDDDEVIICGDTEEFTTDRD